MARREWLIAARKKKKKTQVELCKDLDFNQSFYSAVERGERCVSLERAVKLSEYLDFPFDLWKEDLLNQEREQENENET